MLVLLLLCAVVLAVRYLLTVQRPVNTDAYGSARWAGIKDLIAAGCLECGPGLGIGSVRDGGRLRPVRLNRAVHVLVCAPSGSGKNVTVIIPFLRSCTHSVVVHDPKGENYAICKRSLEENGVRCVRLDPYGVLDREFGPGDTLNPLDLLAPASEQLIDDAKAISKELTPRTGNEPEVFFLDSAERLISGAISITCTLPKDDPNRNLIAARSLVCNQDRFQQMLAALQATASHGGMLSLLGKTLSSHRDKELASVLSTVNTKLSFLDTLPIARSLAKSTFDIRELKTGRLALFIILPPDKIRAMEGYLRLVVGTALRACIAGGPSDRTVTYVLDEASSIGRLESLESALVIGRAFGIRLQLYHQSLSQLRQTWPDGQEKTVMGNCTQVFFGINENDTAEEVSKRLGECSLYVDSFGSNTGGSTSTTDRDGTATYGGSHGRSTTRSLQGRRLMKPEELMLLDRSVAISFPAGCPPVASWLSHYAARPTVTRRWATRTPGWRAVVLAVLAAGLVFVMAQK